MKDNNLLKDRAWIEISLDNLVNNINEIKKIISAKTKIMAVVKANAYGHGSILIAEKLSEIGINDFAVATLDEAIDKNYTNSMIAIGAASPRRGSVLRIRVYPPLRSA